MRTLLAASDFSSQSDKALEQAALLAQQSKARLVVLHVVEDDQPRDLMARKTSEAKALLSARAGDLAHSGPVKVDVLVRQGTPYQVIAETACEQAVDLVVMGAHRKKAWRDVFRDTTIDHVVRVGGIPVLMVNEDPIAEYRRVLFALDVSKPSARAAQTAQALRFLDAPDVSLLHAFWAPGTVKLRQAGVHPAHLARYVEETALEAAVELVSFLHQKGLRDSIEKIFFIEGNPVRVIRHAVARWQPELLIVGTHGHTGLKRMFRGSVAEKILRQVSCDVLVVPLGVGLYDDVRPHRAGVPEPSPWAPRRGDGEGLAPVRLSAWSRGGHPPDRP